MKRNVPVCIFAKPPRTGTAKTRLAASLGVSKAASLAEAFLADTCTLVEGLPWAQPVIASTATFSPVRLPDGFEEWNQGEGDLGQRLERILTRALSSAPFAIALGADSPGLPISLLQSARTSLESEDAVLGPCEDGGFYLLGLTRCPPGLLGGIDWSQPSTFSQTLGKLRTAGLRVRVLEPWFDVDVPQDLAKLRSLIHSGEIAAPATSAACKVVFESSEFSSGLKISIVLPVLNERAWLPKTLADLRQMRGIHEMIVVDGGSTDGTREWLEQQRPYATVVTSERNRGVQMNAGASAATGDVLLFLHADTHLTRDAPEQIERALHIKGTTGGCFFVRFDQRRPSLSLVAGGINLRTRLFHTATGDQAIFARKQIFESAGGYPEWPLFEDVELVRRLRRHGRFAVIRDSVTISARRYLRLGVLRTTCLMYMLRLAFWIGVSPTKLKNWFDDVRPHIAAANRSSRAAT